MKRTIPLRCALTPNLFQACIMAELRQPGGGAASILLHALLAHWSQG